SVLQSQQHDLLHQREPSALVILLGRPHLIAGAVVHVVLGARTHLSRQEAPRACRRCRRRCDL
ncbi:hypothetical protein PMAYCL1PPCAC_26301, partial [Pristionchus mayeri]